MGNLLLQVGSCNRMDILNVEAVSGKQSILASTQVRSPTVCIQIVLCTSPCIHDGVAQSLTLHSPVLPYSPYRRINLQEQFDSGPVHQGRTHFFMLPGLNQKCHTLPTATSQRSTTSKCRAVTSTLYADNFRVKHINLAYFISTQEKIVSSQTFYNPLEAGFLH